jgi:hypoxanthine phosphoribosyltransferase
MTRRSHIEVLYDEATLDRRNRELAGAIAAAGFGDDLVVVALLKGSFIFAADLIRALDAAGIEPEVDFMSLSSYGAGTTSTGAVTLIRDIGTVVTGRNVLIVDDILESGRTLAFAKKTIEERGAARVGIVVLLEKPGKRVASVEADFVGFVCDDVFVVGYGMDAAHKWRQLPFIGHVVGGDD